MENFGVIVNAVRTAVNKKDGKEFIALDLVSLQGVKSKTSGKEYLGTVKASVTTALSKEVAEKLLGQNIGGSIIRKPLEKPFAHTTKDGRKVMVSFETQWVSE